MADKPKDVAPVKEQDFDPLAARKEHRAAMVSLEQRQTAALETIADELTLIRLAGQQK